MPVSPDMQPVHDRRSEEIWRAARRLAGSEADLPLPSLERGRHRSAVNGARFQFQGFNVRRYSAFELLLGKAARCATIRPATAAIGQFTVSTGIIMEAQQKANSGLLIIIAMAVVVAAVAPVWAFFKVKVPFPPMVGDDHGVTVVNAPVNINLVANDADADGRLDLSRITIKAAPQHGIVAVNPESGVCTYAPALDYVGSDKFSYQICDNEGVLSNIGFVAVEVQSPPAAK